MIRVKNLCKRFDKFEALNKVDLNVNKGSIYGLVGSNGAGKTTLLKLLSGIYKEDSGELFIEEQSVFENEEAKNKIFFMPDELYNFPQYTVKSMAEFYEGIYSKWSEERFNKLIEAFNIDIKKRISSMSKGMQKQVEFCVALSILPDIMILDEPFDGLDPVMRKKIKNLLIEDTADREMTIIISSHNLRELEELCDSIGIIHNGKMIIEKDMDELKNGIHKLQVAFKDKASEKEVLEKLTVLYKEEIGSLKHMIVKGDREDIEVEIQKENPLIMDILPLTLEEVFIYEMGDIGYEMGTIIL